MITKDKEERLSNIDAALLPHFPIWQKRKLLISYVAWVVADMEKEDVPYSEKDVAEEIIRMHNENNFSIEEIRNIIDTNIIFDNVMLFLQNGEHHPKYITRTAVIGFANDGTQVDISQYMSNWTSVNYAVYTYNKSFKK